MNYREELRLQLIEAQERRNRADTSDAQVRAANDAERILDRSFGWCLKCLGPITLRGHECPPSLSGKESKE